MELSDKAITELERRDMREIEAHTPEIRLYLATMRQIERVLQSGRRAILPPPIMDQRCADGSAAND